MNTARSTKVLAYSLLLSACTPAPQDPVVVAAPDVEIPAPLASPPATTIEELMNELVMPSAQQLWNAVSYVATEAGVTETLPDTDEEWSQLRTNALALIEAGNTLMLSGLQVGEGDPATAAFQDTPDEIAQLLTDNPQSWQSYIEQLQESTQLTLQAIEFRDVMGLQDFGGQINEACEGCHAQYWYRPQGVMAPQ